MKRVELLVDNRREYGNKRKKGANGKYPGNEISYLTEVSSNTKILNHYLKHPEKEKQANAMFTRILNEILVRHAEGEVQVDEWFINTTLPSLIVEGQICLLAHWKNPVRFLALMCRTVKSEEAIEVPGALQYSFYKLEVKSESKNINNKYITISTVRGNRLCTSRRGWHAIHLPTFNRRLQADLVDGVWEIKPEDEKELIELYLRFVDGMHEKPPADFQRNPKHMGFEQFLLRSYPSPEWRDAVSRIGTSEKQQQDIDDKAGRPRKRRRKAGHRVFQINETGIVMPSGTRIDRPSYNPQSFIYPPVQQHTALQKQTLEDIYADINFNPFDQMLLDDFPCEEKDEDEDDIYIPGLDGIVL